VLKDTAAEAERDGKNRYRINKPIRVTCTSLTQKKKAAC
jgi:hypothetical protein